MKRGRPRIASQVSQMPAVVVPAVVHDAYAREALRRNVPMAEVVREALFSHLETVREGTTRAH